MIKIPVERKTDYSNIEKQINFAATPSKLLNWYKKFIDNYIELNKKYKFSEHFDENFVYKQIEQVFTYKNRALFGIPFGIKDVFNTKVLPTTMGSRLWHGFKAGNNARVVDEACDNGAIIFAKLTTAEFAVHFIEHGKTINPHNTKHITGTSSAGSAVAVASGALPIAFGTQTAGSIIRPASFCNVFGFKPSFGAIDRTGVLKTTDSLDTIGFLGSDIYGLRKSFYTCFQKETENNFYAKNYFNFHKEFTRKEKIKIGIISEQFKGYTQYDSYVIDDFELFLTNIAGRDIILSNVNDINFINNIDMLHDNIYCKSLSYYFKKEASIAAGMSEIMSKMIELGNKVSKEDYVQALKRQCEYRKKFDSIIKEYDFLVTPSTASVAPLSGNKEKSDTCLIWTFLGYPVLSIPIFWSKDFGLPYGVQIIGPKFSDLSLFDFGEIVIHKLKKNLTNKVDVKQ